MEMSMRESGRMIYSMGLGSRRGLAVVAMRGITGKGRRMALGRMFGQTKANTRDLGGTI